MTAAIAMVMRMTIMAIGMMSDDGLQTGSQLHPRTT